MRKKKGGVPEGWLPVSAVGKPVGGTRFLAFKVPLREILCNKLQPDERFTPAILLEKEPNLKLIIDLTNTDKYYDKDEFIQNGVKYEKILCPGRRIPKKKLMIRFFNAVDRFMQSKDTEDKFIGVHCTHGINRTGYFICTYMIQKLGFTPDEAISAFQEARGHEIVRDYFINELKKDDTIKDSGNSDKINKKRKAAHKPKPHKPNPHKPNPHKNNPHKPNPHKNNPHKPNPHKNNPHKNNPHKNNPDKNNPDKNNPHKPNPDKNNPHKPNPDKNNPHKPNPDKNNPHKPNPHKPNPHKPNPHKNNPHKPNPNNNNPHKPNPHKNNPNNNNPDTSSSNGQHQNPQRSLDRQHSRGGPRGGYKNWRGRGRAQYNSGPPAKDLPSPPRHFLNQKSQLNSNEDDGSHNKYHGRKNSMGRGKSPRKPQKSDS